MGEIRTPNNVLLICAVCYNPVVDVQEIEEKLQSITGEILAKTEHFEFDHTRYYQPEMGENLKKYYCTFRQKIEPAAIAEIKIATNDIEEQFAVNQQRLVNFDPGYIEVPKLILATTKNFSHRVYINKGIYGDVQLFWKAGKFQFNPWTYPDYKEPKVLQFFTNARQAYYKELKEGKLL